MLAPTNPLDEAARLDALRRYDILDTPAEAEFDDIAFLASTICSTPIGLISLVDMERQWFKSKFGIDASEMARSISFCGHAIHADEIFEVTDTHDDARFVDNPLGRVDIHFNHSVDAAIMTNDSNRDASLS